MHKATDLFDPKNNGKPDIILMRWLFEHLDLPYPADNDWNALANTTGRTKQQLSAWFINARHRIAKPFWHAQFLKLQPNPPTL